VSDRTYLRRDGRSSARALHPRDLSFGRPSGKREGNLVRFAPIHVGRWCPAEVFSCRVCDGTWATAIVRL